MLYSYAYIGRGCGELLEYLFAARKAGKVDLMLDSGAFTAFNAKTPYPHVNLDDYCRWLDKYAGNFTKYVMLDVILNEKKSRANYEEMVRRGFKPMYVLTANDKDFAYLKEAVKVTPDVCVAGGIGRFDGWIAQRYQKTYSVTDGKARIHGLAFVKFPQMLQLPLTSVDSSTWQRASQRFGIFASFRGDKGFRKW